MRRFAVLLLALVPVPALVECLAQQHPQASATQTQELRRVGVGHYNQFFRLNLTAQEKQDLVDTSSSRKDRSR
jgi:hypothetical protein